MIPLRLPRFFNVLHSWFYRYIMRDPLYADLIAGWHVKSGQEFYALCAQREKYKVQWLDWWKEQELDFLLTVPNALPAMKHGGGKLGWKACGYTFLFNVVCSPTMDVQGWLLTQTTGRVARLLCWGFTRHACR